jgi:hypothetical protein
VSTPDRMLFINGGYSLDAALGYDFPERSISWEPV